jgi:hypothetical protein
VPEEMDGLAPDVDGTHVCAAYRSDARRHRAVGATKATVAVAAAHQAVALATAVIQRPQTCEQARVFAHEVTVWTIIHSCKGSSPVSLSWQHPLYVTRRTHCIKLHVHIPATLTLPTATQVFIREQEAIAVCSGCAITLMQLS